MYYLPTDLINNNYTYSYNGNYYTIKTNLNCSGSSCDCYTVFPKNDYLKSSVYSCSTLDPKFIISYDKFTDDIYYRIDIHKILFIFIILFVIIIFVPYKIFSRMFGRWLKV